MKLRYDQVALELQKKSLAPIYVISGDVPLLVQETAECVRFAAHQAGFNERLYFQVETGFDWSEWSQKAKSLSLFSDKRLLELRFTQNKPGDQGGKVLQEYANNPTPETMLLIVSGKLENSTQQTKWFQALEKQGVFIPIWPIELSQMPQWISQRLYSVGLKTNSQGVKLLTEFAEGNLLAAAQEIEKLKLLYGEGELTPEQISQAIVDNARFDIFNLVDSCLSGDGKRIQRILSHLKATAIEPTLILWALVKELRLLITLQHDQKKSNSLSHLFRQHGVWDKRQHLVKQGLQRHTQQTLYQLLQQASQIDPMMKGASVGNVWHELLQLCFGLGGIVVLSR